MTWNLRRDEEETIFRKRLLHDGHGSGEDRRLMSLIRNITKLAYAQQNPDDISKLHNLITKELGSATNSAERHEKIHEMYDRTYAEIEKATDEMRIVAEEGQKKIDELKLELEFFQKLQDVDQYPDRPTSEIQMKELELRRRQLLERVERQKLNSNLLVEACRSLQKVLEYAEDHIES